MEWRKKGFVGSWHYEEQWFGGVKCFINRSSNMSSVAEARYESWGHMWWNFRAGSGPVWYGKNHGKRRRQHEFIWLSIKTKQKSLFDLHSRFWSSHSTLQISRHLWCYWVLLYQLSNYLISYSYHTKCVSFPVFSINLPILQIHHFTRHYIRINSKTMFECWVSTKWTNNTYLFLSHTRTSGSNSTTHRSGVDCITRWANKTKTDLSSKDWPALFFFSMSFGILFAHFFFLCWFRRTNSAFCVWIDECSWYGP